MSTRKNPFTEEAAQKLSQEISRVIQRAMPRWTKAKVKHTQLKWYWTRSWGVTLRLTRGEAIKEPKRINADRWEDLRACGYERWSEPMEEPSDE